MILLVDMGNTRTKWRLTDGRESIGQGFIASGTPFASLDNALGNYYERIERVLVASVLGQDIENQFTHWCQEFVGVDAEFIQSQADAYGICSAYSEAHLLGVDRWLSLICAFERMGGPCVVVTCGTAITVDLINTSGKHFGGYIAPGICSLFDVLNRNAHLINVEMQPFKLDLAPGCNTRSAVQGAVTAMLVGLVDNAVSQFRSLAQVQEVDVIISGGDGERLLPLLANAKFVPDLVLDGLMNVALQTIK